MSDENEAGIDPIAIEAATEALVHALNHFAYLDRSNAAIHCAPVRYSPITFRTARALDRLGFAHDARVEAVLAHDGAYAEDTGR